MMKNVHHQTLNLVIATATMTAVNANSAVPLLVSVNLILVVMGSLLNMLGMHWILNSKELPRMTARPGQQYTIMDG